MLSWIGKGLGTAVLITTGTASAVLKGVSDTVGFEIGSELLDAAKNASFDKVRSLWNDEELSGVDKLEILDFKTETIARSQMARTAKQAADLAKKNGDMDRYERYMAQYEQYRD